MANPTTPTPLLFTPTKMNYKYFYEEELKTPANKILHSNIKSVKRIHTDVTIPEASVNKGTKNKANIITVFTTIVEFAFLLVLWSLK